MVVDGLSSVLMLGEITSVRPQASSQDASQTGQPWASMDQAAFGVTSLGVPNNTINKWGTTSPKPGKLFSNSAPGSEHPGGCHFTMADGAVRFVSELTSQTVMGQLAQIADGQPLDGL
jgi:prepilin-type processing-associated H-X9-DG protein